MSIVSGALICLAIVAISYFFWNCCQKVFFIRRLNALPGPKTLPLIGSAHHILRLLNNHDDILDVILKIANDYPSHCQLWLGSKLIIGVYEPDEAKIILNSQNCIDKSMLYKFLSPAFGMGLLTVPAPVWMQMRKMTASTFGSHMLKSLFDIFVKQSVTFTYELEKIGLNGNEVILEEHTSNCTLKIAFASLMDVKLEPNVHNRYVKEILRLKDIFSVRSMNMLIYFFDFIFNLTASGREQKAFLNFVHSLCDKIIQQHKNKLNNLNTTKNEKEGTQRTFLDIQLDAYHNENFTREVTRDNMTTLILAASDTIAITVNFVIFILANFPEIQKKVHEELLEIYGTETIESAPINYDDLKYMHYLDRVIKETMRIFPPVPLIGRQVTKDLEIGANISSLSILQLHFILKETLMEYFYYKITGEIVLPKGADILIGILKIHRDEKYWPNPLVFDPDRFLPERIKNRHSYCYLPFSDGPRNCIGMKYGMMCMKIMLATLVRTFIFKVNKNMEIDEIKLKVNTVLATKKPLKIKIEKRSF